jgi:hypothetical protein
VGDVRRGSGPSVDPRLPDPAVIVSNRGKSGGYTSQVSYNHYSLLATVEQVFGLGYLANAADRRQVPLRTEFLTK